MAFLSLSLSSGPRCSTHLWGRSSRVGQRTGNQLSLSLSRRSQRAQDEGHARPWSQAAKAKRTTGFRRKEVAAQGFLAPTTSLRPQGTNGKKIPTISYTHLYIYIYIYAHCMRMFHHIVHGAYAPPHFFSRNQGCWTNLRRSEGTRQGCQALARQSVQSL